MPAPPTITDLIVPDTKHLFSIPLEPIDQLRFFSDFEAIAAVDQPLPKTPSPFLYGREPQWSEIASHIDINRRDTDTLIKSIDELFAPGPISEEKPRLILVLDDAGTGKTTTIKRVAHLVASLGRPVFSVRTFSRIESNTAAVCFSRLKSKCLIVVDGFADHVDQIAELLANRALAGKIVIIGAERDYRREYIDVILSDLPRSIHKLSPLSVVELRQILHRYQDYGLVADSTALRHPEVFAKSFRDEPVAVTVCRILNDFRPLDSIVDSLWNAARPEDRYHYLCVALSQHCYSAGLRYSILQAIAGPGSSVARLLEPSAPLRLSTNARDDEFVITLNGVIGERVLYRSTLKYKSQLFDAFSGLAESLAPHVNRKAIKRRSPEARLAGRLFDADKIVKPLLHDQAEKFYIAVQKQWEWNSRYWEQRALLLADVDLVVSLQYARHAVAIERHPYPLTTLGKLLFLAMEVTGVHAENLFDEAVRTLLEAIELETSHSRITVHPSATLLNGTAKYLESGGTLTQGQKRSIAAVMRDVMACSPFLGPVIMGVTCSFIQWTRDRAGLLR